MHDLTYDKVNFLVLITIVFVAYVKCLSFNYENEGPDVWPHEIEGCAGRQQSPININDWEAKYEPKLTGFNFQNYDTNQDWNVTHNGHTVVFNPLASEDNGLKFTTDSLVYTYYIQQFHFHWGENDYQGSEHYIDGNKYPLEMHLVHKSKFNTSAVLGFFFNMSPNDTDNPLLNTLISAVNQDYNASNVVKTTFKISDIIPSNVRSGSYYRYVGSLTTPPCTEGIIWTVFETPIEISTQQLEAFHKNSIAKNFRYPQRLYKRDVLSSRPERRANIEGCSQFLKANYLLVFIYIISSFFFKSV